MAAVTGVSWRLTVAVAELDLFSGTDKKSTKLIGDVQVACGAAPSPSRPDSPSAPGRQRTLVPPAAKPLKTLGSKTCRSLAAGEKGRPDVIITWAPQLPGYFFMLSDHPPHPNIKNIGHQANIPASQVQGSMHQRRGTKRML